MGNVPSGFNIGSLHIQYYGLIMAIAMAVGVVVACLNAKKRGLTSNDILILACYVLPLAVIGARIYYVIFSLDEFSSFWQVFEIWNGGLAIYGGVIGGAVAIMLYCLIHKKNFFAVADIAVVSLILGQAIGRIGCFFSGCCYGIEVTNQAHMWFPLSTQINGVWHYSTFFYESFWDFLVFAALMLVLYLGKKIQENGVVMSLYFILYGVGRAWIEALRGDSLYLGAIKVSQLLSILLIIAGLAIITVIYVYKYGLKKPLKVFEFKKPLPARTEVVETQNEPSQTEGIETKSELSQTEQTKSKKTKKRNDKKE